MSDRHLLNGQSRQGSWWRGPSGEGWWERPLWQRVSLTLSIWVAALALAILALLVKGAL